MSETKKYIQENALDVIERFGGIRPMATKLGVAATTIQGWKKRESIPDSRINDIIKAANENDIMLASTPNIEATIAQIKAKIEEPKDAESETPDEELMEFSSEETADEPDEDVEKEEKKELPPFMTRSEPATTLEPSEALEENKPAAQPPKASQSAKKPANSNVNTQPPSRNSGGWVLPMVFGACLMAGIAVFWPVREDVQLQKQRLSQIEENINDLKQEQNSFIQALGDYMPEDIRAQMEEFKNQTGELGQQVNNLASQTKEMAESVIGEENTAALKERLAALETQFSSLMSTNQIQSIMARFSQLNDTEAGQEQLDRAIGQLHGIIGSLDGRMDLLDDALIVARENSTALGETFEGVANEDLTAGALLLGLTQFRSALNRDNMPFEEDLALLYSMVDTDNAELRASLDRLAPQAENGVLSASGLANEFRSFAGEIAVNSLKGEDVTIGEQATARLSKVLQIKKGDQTLLGNEPDEKIQQIQTDLNQGNLRDALATLSTFSGSAATSAAPFMEKLQATIAAQDVSAAITKMLNTAQGEITGVKPINLKNPTTTITESMTPNTIVKDDESGFTILPQNKMNSGFKDLNIAPKE